MSFVYIVVAKMGDAEGFGTAAEEWAADHLMEMGAISSTATEVIMGGEIHDAAVCSLEGQQILQHEDAPGRVTVSVV